MCAPTLRSIRSCYHSGLICQQLRCCECPTQDVRHRSPPARPECHAPSPKIRDQERQSQVQQTGQQRASTLLSTSFRRDAIGACPKTQLVWSKTPFLSSSVPWDPVSGYWYTTSHICRSACALRVSDPCSAKSFFRDSAGVPPPTCLAQMNILHESLEVILPDQQTHEKFDTGLSNGL